MTTKTVHIGLRCKKCNTPIKEGDQAWWVGKKDDYIAGLTCMHCTEDAWVIAE